MQKRYKLTKLLKGAASGDLFQTFLVGERPEVSDYSVYSSLHPVFCHYFTEPEVNRFPRLVRWFKTIEPEVQFCQQRPKIGSLSRDTLKPEVKPEMNSNLTAAEIRNQFLEFFKNENHTYIHSRYYSSLMTHHYDS